MNIPIILCFDNNFARPAFVTIKSLSVYAGNETKYEVFCIVNKDVTAENKKFIKSISNEYLIIQFIDARGDFEDSHQHRGITESSYYRLIVHDLLPHLNKVIYLDVDVLVNDDLTQLYTIELGENIIGAVKNLYVHQVFDKHMLNIDYWKVKFQNSKYTYINAGVLLMNLSEIRNSEVWKKWIELSKYKWEYHDQDILNMSCSNKILFIPPKYNATYPIRAKGAGLWDLFSKEELSETPVIYHFTAKKPWNAKYMNQADVWWSFIKKYDITKYRYFLKRYRESQTPSVKLQRFYQRSIKRIFKTIKNY